MRLLIAGLAILIVVTLLCYANQVYLESCLEAVINDIDAVVSDVQNEDWDSASEKLSAVMDAWFAKKVYYMSVIIHEHIDDAEASMTELKSHIDAQSRSEAEKAARQVQIRLRQMIFEEILNLANLF
ncbi:MAG: DUF4363 family protein [Clostridiales bacterium]|nr:DUF4363 family protein [Clostridiales bacterium]